MVNLLILIIGLVAVTYGANWLTDGSSVIAKKFGVTEFLIGMTIVAVGTSLPELVVSLFAAIESKADLSVGNIVGSNICNIFLILGITAAIVPIPLHKSNLKFDIPLTFGISALFAILALDEYLFHAENVISRFDGAILLILYILFLVLVIKNSKQQVAEQNNSDTNKKEDSLLRAITFTILGFVALIGGARLFIDGAVGIARVFNVSEAVIGITIVAVGTSLPELAASFVAALKGRSEMAIGNILGSNIANILLIIGSASLVSPLKLVDIASIDFLIMILGPVLLFLLPLLSRSFKITRIHGIVLFLIYISYISYLLIYTI